MNKTIKALTIKQPYASLLAHGVKLYETRPFKPASLEVGLNGEYFAIHSGKKPNKAMLENDQVIEALRSCGETIETLTYGHVIAIGQVVKVHQTEAIGCPPFESLVGDWRKGRYAWEVRIVHRFVNPHPATGKLGLWAWELPPELSDYAK